MIAGCVGLYGERVDQATECIKRLRPHVDRYVVIVDKSVTEEQKQWLRDLGCEVYFHPFEDSMVKIRNQYLEKCQTDDWIIVHDPDEWFCEKFCEDVRKICEKAEKDDLALLLINSHDITYQEDETKTELVSDFFKNLIFRKMEGTHYEGVGEVKEVHETLIIPGLTRAMRLPKETYWYEHVKYWHEVWERAARNVFLAGGGNNVGERNPSWKPLREIFDELGVHTWPEAREYLREGGIDPRLKMWLWANRFEGLDFDHEEMEFGRWYFEYLHPEEAEGWEPVTELEEGSPPEVMRYVEQTYMKVLGRHADQEGKEAYTKAILTGQLRREDLPALLKRSPEYIQKVPSERVKIQVPVSVDVHLTEEVFLEALKRSKTYWEIIKPKLDLAFKFDSYLAIQKKAETGGRGTDYEPVEQFLHYVEKNRKIMPPEEYPNILEIGAGAGSETKAFMDSGYKVTGITFGEDNIRYAKENYDIDLTEMDMHSLNFPEGFFDGIVCIHTFEHALAPNMVIGEMRYVLRDGGRVYIPVPDVELKSIWHTNLLYPDQIVSMFKYWGFKEVKSEAIADKWEFAFEKLPDDHPDFEHDWGYLRHIYAGRKSLGS